MLTVYIYTLSVLVHSPSVIIHSPGADGWSGAESNRINRPGENIILDVIWMLNSKRVMGLT